MRNSLIKNTLALSICICIFFMPENIYAYQVGDMDIDIKGSLNGQYDDNINFSETNAKSDFVTVLSLGADINLIGRQQVFSLNGNIRHNLFSKYSNFSNTSKYIALKYKSDLSRYDRVSVSNTFTHSQEPGSFDDSFGRTSGRYSRYINRFNIDYSKDITKQIFLSFRFGNETNEITREDILDSVLYKTGATIGYFMSSETIFSLAYDFSQREFDPGSKITTNTATVGMRHYLTGQLYLESTIGLDFISFSSSSKETQPAFMVSLVNEFDDQTIGGIYFVKQYTTSSDTEDLFDSWKLSCSYGRQMIERLRCSLSAFYGEGDYISLRLKDKQSGISGTVTYDITENIQGRISYTYTNIDSTLNTREYSRNTLLLGITWKF
ncbi:MAG: outer membrane beta-barrel protein [Candidatus Omnitrophica bacterium]|nr:outer membrane beta-barrel protein [Candidatus Omnitrophota bacterium]